MTFLSSNSRSASSPTSLSSTQSTSTSTSTSTATSKSKHAHNHDDIEERPPYLHAIIAGGIGGSTGDLMMHSLDTVKTRQQGDPHIPPKYTSLGSSYYTIWRQEGIRRGLYGGWLPALSGSFPGTMIFFGTYEWSKRLLIDHGVQSHVAYFSAGIVGDVAASGIYVPSEVLKTRLQLQGRFNNPYFQSGYNYRGTVDAVRTIIRQEGFSALFYGYQATLYRDVPFSALQFMFWEQFHSWACQYKESRDIGMGLELLTGAGAGGLAGFLTCPLDVVKTRLQTQVSSSPVSVLDSPAKSSLSSQHTPPPPPSLPPSTHTTTTSATTSHTAPSSSSPPSSASSTSSSPSSSSSAQKRAISTSSPSTHTPVKGAPNLATSSVLHGLRAIYQTEGIGGWFRGVGPRSVWTFIQSGCMLFLYQRLLHQFQEWSEEPERAL